MVNEKLNVQVGDTVIISNTWGRSLGTVEKITPKGAIRVNGTLYTPDGHEKGSDVWNRNTIIAATDEAILEFKQTRFASQIKRTLKELKELSYEQAVQIAEILGIDTSL